MTDIAAGNRDTERLDLIASTKTYPFWNIGKWSFRHGDHWYHAPTVRDVLDAALDAAK